MGRKRRSYRMEPTGRAGLPRDTLWRTNDPAHRQSGKSAAAAPSQDHTPSDGPPAGSHYFIGHCYFCQRLSILLNNCDPLSLSHSLPPKLIRAPGMCQTIRLRVGNRFSGAAQPEVNVIKFRSIRFSA